MGFHVSLGEVAFQLAGDFGDDTASFHLLRRKATLKLLPKFRSSFGCILP